MDYQKRLKAADNDVANREKLIKELVDEYENGVTLIGATAVEDALQDEVPETIAELLKAGIKVWMLTGDKLETAENIANSCNLVTEDMDQYIVAKPEDVEHYFGNDMMHKFFPELIEFARPSKTNDKSKADEERKKSKPRASITDSMCDQNEPIKKALIIEESAMNEILAYEFYKQRFIFFSKQCAAVVCSRFSPSLKQRIVALIKNSDKDLVTLSIGDGANDVPMILEAHIGIGLYGNEGMRAV